MASETQVRPPTLLCVANFPANTGFAWDFIEGLYARCADALAPRRVRTLVAYPRIDSPPRSLLASTAHAVEVEASPERLRSLPRLLRLLRREGVRVIYYTDYPSRLWSYPLLRLAGVRRIIVHDHASGIRLPPRGIRRVLKTLYARVPGVTADRVIAVSDFVARRQAEVALIPMDRITRVWNGLEMPASVPSPSEARQRLGLPLDRPIIVTACRGTPEKGVQHLLRAFDRACQACQPPPLLIYVGDGPYRSELEAVRASLASNAQIQFTGYRTDVRDFLCAADVCVVPSTWQDALPLSVLEAMGLGRAVIASSVGGIPEMCRHGEEGMLVPPGDETSLAAALTQLLESGTLREQLGRRGRSRVRDHFTPAAQLTALLNVLEPGLDSQGG